MFKAIKWLAIFLYHFFFIDQATGHQSNTKFFANVGYIIWCYLFPYAVIYGSKAAFDLWLVFGAVVIGNRTLNVMMQNKAGVNASGDGSWKQMMQPVDGDVPDTSTVTQTTVTTATATVTAPPAAAKPALTAKPVPVVPNTDDLVQ